MSDTLIILGTCGSARETYWVAKETHPDDSIVFVDDNPGSGDTPAIVIHDVAVPVVRDWNFEPIRRAHGRGGENAFREFVCGMGGPTVKRFMSEKAVAHGLKPAPTLVSEKALVRPDCVLGRGGVIHPGAYLYTNATLGDYVTFYSARCGHDTVFDDYVTCTSGCNIAGHAHLETGVFLGVAVSVHHRIRIAPWVTVGMHSAVTKDLPEPAVVMIGCPAKKAREADFPAAFLDTWPEGWREGLRDNAAG